MPSTPITQITIKPIPRIRPIESGKTSINMPIARIDIPIRSIAPNLVDRNINHNHNNIAFYLLSLDVKLDYVAVLKDMFLADPLPVILS